MSNNRTEITCNHYLFQSLPDLGAFTIMFFIQFFSFAQFAYLIFGTHMEQYSTLTSCIYTQFRMVLGDFDFPAMRRAHEFLGPVYFFVFIFLVFFILMVRYINKFLHRISTTLKIFLNFWSLSEFIRILFMYYRICSWLFWTTHTQRWKRTLRIGKKIFR